MSTSSTDPADITMAEPGPPRPSSNGDAADGAGEPELVSSPPMPAGLTATDRAEPPRPGDVVARWRVLLGTAWVLAFFAYAAVWNASVQIGIGTWWLGPRADSTNVLVKLLPFVLCIACVLYIAYNGPRVVRVSALGAALAAIGSLPDLSRSLGLGIAELIIAGLLGIVTAAALTGRYRHVAPEPLTPPPPPAD